MAGTLITPEVIRSLSKYQLLPVVTIDEKDRAADLAKALVDGGIRCAEIALRTPDSVQALERIANSADLLVGAGTVLTIEDVDTSLRSGAQFVVSPGLDQRVIEHALEVGLEVIPGVATATEIQKAISLGLDHLKLFPANLLGGPKAIRSFGEPFPGVSFMPSGGVSYENAPEYLSLSNVFAISGSWISPREMIQSQDFETIQLRCLSAVQRLQNLHRQ